MEPAVHNLTIWQGARWPGLVITAKGADGSAFDLTGWTAAAAITRRTALSGSAKTVTLDASITDDTGGEITIAALDSADTAALRPGPARWHLTLVDGDGEPHGPYLIGDVAVKQYNAASNG